MKRKFVPAIVTSLYAIFFLVILSKSVFWEAGDQSDVVQAGIAAAPLGMVVSALYQGGRNAAFVAVTVCAGINAFAIYLVARRLTGTR